MDIGPRPPLLDCFVRGDVPRDVRLLAARGAVAPRAHEQLALLALLTADDDAEVAATASRTIDSLPPASLGCFIARAEVSTEVRKFYEARGVVAQAGGSASDAPLVVDVDEEPEVRAEIVADDEIAAVLPPGADPTASRRQPLSSLSVIQRIKLAMNGTREQRSVLIRDPNRLVASAVLSSPKLSETEVEAISRMTNVSDEVLRIVATNRAWTKSYSVLSALVRNPKTPPALSFNLVPRLNERDIKNLSIDRNVPEGLRLLARKMLVANESRRK